MKFSSLIEIAEDHYDNEDDHSTQNGHDNGASLGAVGPPAVASPGLYPVQAEGRAELRGPGEEPQPEVTGVLGRAHHLHLGQVRHDQQAGVEDADSVL